MLNPPHFLKILVTFGQLRGCCLILGLALLANTAHAGISVTPLSGILKLNEQRSHLLTVINTDKAQPVAIKVRALRWQLDPDGVDIRSATDDLVLFPIQFILPAGSRRSIRIAPRNHTEAKLEKSYRVMVQEVPVNLIGDNPVNSGVRLITAYGTAFYVAPSKPASELIIVKASTNQQQLSFTLSNIGNAHTHLHKTSIILLQSGKEHVIENPEVLKGIYNENILAQSHRNFTFTWPKSLLKVLDLQAPMAFQLKVNCESCAGRTVVLEFNIP